MENSKGSNWFIFYNAGIAITLVASLLDRWTPHPAVVVLGFTGLGLTVTGLVKQIGELRASER